MIAIGIDPGATGAIGVVSDTLLYVVDMPVTRDGLSGKSVIDAGRLSFLLQSLQDQDGDVHVAIEHVHAMPKQGVVSMFTFGRALGTIDGVCGALGLTPVYVTPQRWMSDVGLKLKGGKAASREYALELFPTASDLLKRAKDHNRAEALLIARWMHGTITGTLFARTR